MKAIAEAPCKAIITGEHFVVHGALALAAALDRSVRVEVSKSEETTVESDAFPAGGRQLEPVRAVVQAMALEHGFRPHHTVRISSSVPDGAGLGSSASVMVALAAALSSLHSLSLSTEELVESAMVGERLIHGRPSGIDANVCARGGVILYTVGEKPRQLTVEGKRRIIVAHSGSKRSTGRLIASVSETRERLPSFFNGLASAVSGLSEEAAEALRMNDTKRLGSILTLNHALLSAVGASTKELDRLVDGLISAGCTGAKLTGAGGGGSVIAVPGRGKEKRAISWLKRGGFEAFVAEIPVGGVKSWLER